MDEDHNIPPQADPLLDGAEPASRQAIEPEEGVNPYAVEEHLLQRGDYYDIRQKIPQLNLITIGAGWDHKAFEEDPLDIDLSCFLLNKADQTREDQDFVFYNNDKACEGAVRHNGDSRNGAGDGDDESISIDLNGIPFDVLKIVFTLTIYNAEEREHRMGTVRNLYLRLVNHADQNEIFRFQLSEEEYAGMTGIKVGELVREGPKWYFNALGEPISGGLGGIATQYGLIITL